MLLLQINTSTHQKLFNGSIIYILKYICIFYINYVIVFVFTYLKWIIINNNNDYY